MKKEKKTMKEDKETKEFIREMLKQLEPILAKDWDSEEDSWWDNVKGIPFKENSQNQKRITQC